MSEWDTPSNTQETNSWTTFANKAKKAERDKQGRFPRGHGQGFQENARGKGRGRGNNYGMRQQPQQQYNNNQRNQHWNDQQESKRDLNHNDRSDNNSRGWNNNRSQEKNNVNSQDQGWNNNNVAKDNEMTTSSWNDNNSSNTSSAPTPSSASNNSWGNNKPETSGKTSGGWGNNTTETSTNTSSGWGDNNTQAAANTSGGWENTKSEAPKAASGGWQNTNSEAPKAASGGWGNTKPKAPKAASGGWGNTNSEAPKATSGGWGNNKTQQITGNNNLAGAISGGWETVASSKPANNWNTANNQSNQWSQPPTPVSNTPTESQSSSSGWDEKPKSKDIQWGAMSLDDLGWSEKNQKASLEPCQGTWKNGVHVLGEDNEKVRLKIFGTVEDKETMHSGINFNKYENIPVEAKGKNVPEGIHDFETSNLDKHLLTNIELAHFKVPTPVQKHSIPIVMNGHGLMACAQTGSGKTAGFLFPILSIMFSNGPLEEPKEPPVKKGYQFYKKSYPQALILAPTRELASQIYKEAKKYCYRSYVRPCVAYGGADISAQLRLIDRGCHILIATPGRLVDLLERRRISFKNIQYLVLDEADRMLDMGFEPQVRRIVEGEDMPPADARQTLMFSATFPENIQKLARDFLSSYIFLSVGRVGGTSDNITQEIKLVKEEEKKKHLIDTLVNKKEAKGLTLVFSQTKRMVDSICKLLNDRNFPATAIHGDRIQSEREEALESFKKGITPILVATAVAARGLDIPNVTHVISFDLPNDIDDYVHRIGRTGRAGNTGFATTFFTPSDKFLAGPLVKLLKDANQQVPGWLEEMSKEVRVF